jgi:hypothetical protein
VGIDIDIVAFALVFILVKLDIVVVVAVVSTLPFSARNPNGDGCLCVVGKPSSNEGCGDGCI